MKPRNHISEDDVCLKVDDTAGREWDRQTALRAHQGAGPCHLLDTRAAQTVPAMKSDRIFEDFEADAAYRVLRIVRDVFLFYPLGRGVGFVRGHVHHNGGRYRVVGRRGAFR